MTNIDLSTSRDYVLEQAKANIAAIKENPSYLERAKQVNVALQSLVAMERNAVMLEAIRSQQRKSELRRDALDV